MLAFRCDHRMVNFIPATTALVINRVGDDRCRKLGLGLSLCLSRYKSKDFEVKTCIFSCKVISSPTLQACKSRMKPQLGVFFSKGPSCACFYHLCSLCLKMVVLVAVIFNEIFAEFLSIQPSSMVSLYLKQSINLSADFLSISPTPNSHRNQPKSPKTSLQVICDISCFNTTR